ncbi:MAG: CPBP family glutamic-type intramembrane protease [Bacillota bacterium]
MAASGFSYIFNSLYHGGNRRRSSISVVFISFWVWLISYKILKKKYFDLVFWIVAVASAVVFAVSHFPSIMYLIRVESIQALPEILIVELLVMNGIVSLFAAYYLRRYGFLVAVGIHFWTNVVWHVL